LAQISRISRFPFFNKTGHPVLLKGESKNWSQESNFQLAKLTAVDQKVNFMPEGHWSFSLAAYAANEKAFTPCNPCRIFFKILTGGEYSSAP
jgi:hypothetical protein